MDSSDLTRYFSVTRLVASIVFASHIGSLRIRSYKSRRALCNWELFRGPYRDRICVGLADRCSIANVANFQANI